MIVSVLSAGLATAIALILGLRAWVILRREQGMLRGSPPGEGHHTLRAEYFSGGGGGGEATEYHVPKDPQAYARLFVPRGQNSKEDRT